MAVVHVTLHRDKILALPAAERTLLLSLGHLANEINATTKLLNWAASAPSSTEAHHHGQFALMLMFVRLLAGALNEGWELYRKAFFGTALSKTYEPILDSAATPSLKSLKRYFSSRNAAHVIRNSFAFHYSVEEVASALPAAEEHLHAYLERSSAPNNLFHFSEELLALASIEVLAKEYKKLSLEELVAELFEVSLWFSQASDAIMAAIIDVHARELRAKDPEPAALRDLRQFHEVYVPWFTDTSTAPTLTPGSAQQLAGADLASPDP